MINVVQKLTQFLSKYMAPPLASIPAFMLICTSIKRPGLSPIQITGRVINRMGEKGMLIGANIDGSDNKMNQMVYMIVDEMVKAIQLDAKVDVGIAPGAITTQGVAPPGGGPVTSTNLLPGSATGIMF